MTLPLFTQSVECTSRAHCRACRSAAGSFRRMMATRYAPPAGGEDFECPHGLPWGRVTGQQKEPMRGMGDVVAKITKAVGIKPCVGCQKRREAMNKAFPFKSAGEQ